jgi:4-amino-4-deoxy-L-arabinose transferase-like glycosyltransferase
MKEHLLNKALLIILLAVTVAKFIHIEADPWLIKSTTDIHDEAWWAENARLKIQNNYWIEDNLAGGIAVSPIVNVIYYISFKLFGISFFSLRIFSLVASLLSLISYFILSKKILKKLEEALISTVIFASLPLYFIIARTGLLETSMLLFLLISINLVYQSNNIFNFFLSGTIAGLGIYLKGSFIVLIPIIICFLLLTNKEQLKKKLILYLIAFAIINCVFYIFYYIPYYQKFVAYFQAFNAEFYSISELLNPLGIPIRLANIFSKETITDPFIFIYIFLIIYKSVFYNWNKEQYILATAILVGFIFTLFTDFNDRRLILFCFAWPIFIAANLEKRININYKILRNWAFILSFSLLNFFPKIYILNWNYNLFMGYSKDSIILFSLIIFALFVILNFIIQIRKYKIIAQSLYWSFILISLIQSYFIIIKKQPNFIIISALISFFLIICWIFKLEKEKLNYFQKVSYILIFSQILFIFINLKSDSYEIRNLNLFFAKYSQKNQRIIGQNSIYEISFLSKVHPVQFSGLGKVDNKVDKDKIIWFGGISNDEHSEKSIIDELRIVENNLKFKFILFHKQSIYKDKSTVYIFKRMN